MNLAMMALIQITTEELANVVDLLIGWQYAQA